MKQAEGRDQEVEAHEEEEEEEEEEEGYSSDDILLAVSGQEVEAAREGKGVRAANPVRLALAASVAQEARALALYGPAPVPSPARR